MKIPSYIITSVILGILILIGILVFLAWRLGILKKEIQITPELRKINQIVNYIQNFSFGDLQSILPQLPQGKIEIPKVSPEEIGRDSFFNFFYY